MTWTSIFVTSFKGPPPPPFELPCTRSKGIKETIAGLFFCDKYMLYKIQQLIIITKKNISSFLPCQFSILRILQFTCKMKFRYSNYVDMFFFYNLCCELFEIYNQSLMTETSAEMFHDPFA